MTLESERRDTHCSLIGMVGGGPLKFQSGQWTDEPAMALALADSLVHDPALDAGDMMTRLVDWQTIGCFYIVCKYFSSGRQDIQIRHSEVGQNAPGWVVQPFFALSKVKEVTRHMTG